MKKIIYLVVGLFVALSITSCSWFFGNSSKDDDSISSEYWGYWIQMDTGDEYYIDNTSVYEVGSYSNSVIQTGISGYYLEAEDVLRNESTVYFRKGGRNRSFTVSLSGFSSTLQNARNARGAGTGSQTITGRRNNKQNSADEETVEVSNANLENSEIKMNGGVAEDPQIVTVTDGTNSGVAVVTPKFNGENIGTIPIVEEGKYAFKTTYSVSNADNQGFMYGNNLGLYKITFNLTNVGSEICDTSIYQISWSDPALKSTNLEKTGNFTSIKAGDAKSITGMFSYGAFTSEYKDVRVNIKITDSKYMQTWEDFVTLRFYRGWVNLKVNARNFNEKSSAKLKGFLIYPDKRSNRFTVSSGNTTTVKLPWSQSDYYIVLSGASAENEMCYSFGFSKTTDLADLSGTWSISDINAYESNDTLITACSVTNFSTPIKAYLKNGDIDYYKINNSTVGASSGKIEYVEKCYADLPSIDSNNGDGKVNPGETIWMDFKVQNTGGLSFNDVKLELSTSSSYVEMSESSAEYGNIASNCCKTYYYERSYGSDTGFSADSTSNYYNLEYSKYVPFKFTISKNCPIGTSIPFTLKITEASGNEWTDSFSLTVEKANVELKWIQYGYSDSSSFSNSNNADSKVNPGETIGIDPKVQNTGTSMALGVTVKLSTTSPYATIIGDSVSYGKIASNYCKNYGYIKYWYSSNSGYSDSTSSYYYDSYRPFKVSISSDCPVGTEIPLTLTMTDSSGNEWTASCSPLEVE